jgi:hypothetical protein
LYLTAALNAFATKATRLRASGRAVRAETPVVVMRRREFPCTFAEVFELRSSR